MEWFLLFIKDGIDDAMSGVKWWGFGMVQYLDEITFIFESTGKEDPIYKAWPVSFTSHVDDLATLGTW